MSTRIGALWLLLLSGVGFGGDRVLAQNPPSDLTAEEAENYFDKWLEEDVAYILADEERAVFERLSTPDEKEQFIEQFWFRRDPDPRTRENEFKEEHYRRIAYANEHFGSGKPGWMTDRGRVYIIHGTPAQIERHPTGGYYERPISEGGGSTNTYPFEIWRYRYIEGIGDDLTLEFVDPSLSGEYRLALLPDEKDALLFVPGVGGATLAERLGEASKRDRPFFSPANRDEYPLMARSFRDNPFYRYETYALIQAPTEIRYNDLKELVKVNVEYVSLPVKVKEDYFVLNSTQALVPVNVQLQNKSLSFVQEGNLRVARVGVYGLVTNISNRIVAEFEDDLIAAYSQENLEQGLTERSLYQKLLVLDRGQRYKMDLIVKDTSSQQVGVVRKALTPAGLREPGKLAASSVILADYIKLLSEAPDPDEMFVIGNIKVRPNLNAEFTQEGVLGLYFQLYNCSLDQATKKPVLRITYDLLHDGREVARSEDFDGNSVQYFSEDRVVIVMALKLIGLNPGRYEVRIQVTDSITDQEIALQQPFSLVGSDTAISSGE